MSTTASDETIPVVDIPQQPPAGYYLRLQRKQRLEALVSHRKGNVRYLRDFHLGNRYWLNCVHVTSQEIGKHMGPILGPRRILALFHLGLGISKLLDLSVEAAENGNAYNCSRNDARSNLISGSGFIRAVFQLFEEWEYSTSGSAVQVINKSYIRHSCKQLRSMMILHFFNTSIISVY